MTITSTSRIVPERRLPTPPNDGVAQSQPRIFPAPDFPFKGWQPPQPDGYQSSAAAPAENAIVIDNGKDTCQCVRDPDLLTVRKAPAPSKQDSASTKPPVFLSRLSWQSTKIENSINTALLLDTMPTLMLRPEVRFGRLLSNILAFRPTGTSWREYTTISS